ncbi:hypothetical protein AWENTII_007768 [Aspergillus wentii]
MLLDLLSQPLEDLLLGLVVGQILQIGSAAQPAFLSKKLLVRLLCLLGRFIGQIKIKQVDFKRLHWPFDGQLAAVFILESSNLTNIAFVVHFVRWLILFAVVDWDMESVRHVQSTVRRYLMQRGRR